MNGHLLIERLTSYLQNGGNLSPVKVWDLIFDCRGFLESILEPLQRGAEHEKKCHETLKECEHEILRLRRSNEILAAKVEVMDLFAQTLNTKPAERNYAASPDVVFQIAKRLEGL